MLNFLEKKSISSKTHFNASETEMLLRSAMYIMLFLNSTNLIFSAIRFENALSIIIDKSKRLAGMSLKNCHGFK